MPTIETAAIPTLMLEQSRILRAPRERVYEAWTNPEILKQWFGNPKSRCSEATLNVHPGGSYRITVTPVDPPETPGQECGTRTTSAFGSYTKVVPNELLQFTWSSDWFPGEDTLVTVTFQEARGGTQLNIRHERFQTEASRDAHNNGWATCFDRIANVLDQQ